MASIWRGPRGVEVQIIVLDTTPLFKVTQVLNGRRYFLAYSASIDGLRQHVDLADLVEVIALPVGRGTP
ncbi:transposase [Nonomuraea turkmeniaca]|uniref:Transposase n=1 Tax=Nonomuraea turkmeniaca TaxID=103838 RepID=A0A5S4FW58_9ACTN|nr:transposase [Nonomuraea turkmeniaca]TMR24879.1 transposase [Nonomuraea turkmeniaca]